MQLPPTGDKPYVYVELDLEVDWKPADGFFGLFASLAPTSYVLDRDCHLTGGFAFYLWYQGVHAGQFVLTLGGYHPDFKVPAYFPAVPRLGINWTISDKITLTGDAYFALTPGSVMAGGGWSLNFHDGKLKAWFTAQADLLITFKPFYFTVDISISVGVSYKLDLLFTSHTVKVELGASLDLWGPPIGAKVKVDFYIVSFTIDLGASGDNANTTPLEWAAFMELLPSGKENTLTINGGMTRQTDAGTWVVRADEFVFTTNSVIPARKLRYNGTDQVNEGDYDFDIRPMNLTGIDSVHNLEITRQGDNSPLSGAGWTFSPVTRNMPATLWGAPLTKNGSFVLNPSTPSNATIPDAPVGIRVEAPAPMLGVSPGPLPIAKLEYEPLMPQGSLPFATNSTPFADYSPEKANTSVAQIGTAMDSSVLANRNAIYSSLVGAGLFNGSNGSLSQLVADADTEYNAPPMLINTNN